MTAPHRTFPPPSGVQYELQRSSHRAVVTEVGATLRTYTVDGADVIDGFDIAELSPAGRGQVLAPWPNRLADGHYTFEGRAGQAALDEPERRNAIHGLVRWLAWRPVSQAEHAVVLESVLHPQPAYPWRLELSIEYRLVDDGLAVSTLATNLSDTAAPFGIGFHPYLTVGTDTVDSASLMVPAQRRLLADERGLPSGDLAVSGSDYDFTTPRPIGQMKLDTAYTELAHGDDGRAVARLDRGHGDDGDGLILWVDTAYRYLMVFTGDTLEPAGRRRRSVALEPMTCPPDALRSGTDLIRLDPGASWRGSWGITRR
jgi:aldose 1-epimerase